MTDRVLNTRNQPRRTLVRGETMMAQNVIRVYRASPEDVMLQLRRTKDFVGIALTFSEARQLAEMLLEAVSS